MEMNLTFIHTVEHFYRVAEIKQARNHKKGYMSEGKSSGHKNRINVVNMEQITTGMTKSLELH